MIDAPDIGRAACRSSSRFGFTAPIIAARYNAKALRGVEWVAQLTTCASTCRCAEIGTNSLSGILRDIHGNEPSNRPCGYTMIRPILHRPTLADAEDLLAFELTNRAYFEHWINARPASYYALDAVKQAIAQAAHEQNADSSHQFLIKLEQQIVGRVNLTGMARGHFHKATLGYRIAKEHTGHGIASAAIDQVIDLAFREMGLWRLEATVREENQGSVKVLVRNGFRQFGRARQSLLMHGQWYDLLYFERHNHNWAGPIR